MTKDNDLNEDDIPSLIPERDELASHSKRKVKRRPASSGGPVVHEVVSTRTSGGVIFMLILLFLGVCGSGAGGYYFYTQGLVTEAELLKASTRIAQLEGYLNQVDQAAEQSSMDLVERVNFNFSEIDKLWAARNTLRTEVGDLKTSMTAEQSATKSLQTTVAAHSKTLNENVASMIKRIDEINRNFAGMDNLGDQLTVLNADMNRVKTSMSTLEKSVLSRLGVTEQDIESINVYRLQMNQAITSMQDSINALQQRVGQPSPSTP